jgi:hypothetical protein
MEGVDVDNMVKADHFDLVALAPSSLFVHLDTLNVGVVLRSTMCD